MANRDWSRNNRDSRARLISGRSQSASNFRLSQMENRLREPRLSLGAGIRDLERRTAEVPTILRNNLINVIDELRPIVERARSRSTDAGTMTLPSWLNVPPNQAATVPRESIRRESSAPVSSNDVVIDVEEGLAPRVSPAGSPVGTGPSTTIINNNNNNNNNSPSSNSESSLVANGNTVNNNNNNSNDNNNETANEEEENIQLVANDSIALNTILQYVPFVTLVITKFVFDNIPDILFFISLWTIFFYYNALLKREVARQTRTCLKTLMFCISIALLLIVLFYIIYSHNSKLILCLGKMPEIFPKTLSSLLWSVVVTDFVLKFFTIIIKALFTLLPQCILSISKRGKYYLFIEAISQLYRDCAPMQPWLYFLMESYEGPHKVVGVFLSAAYMVSKGNLLMPRFKLCWSSFLKVIRNVTIGITPTKEQISTVGNLCSICHDEFKTPVLLECNHIFCEICVCKWLDREQTCPLCRAKIVDDPSWRDGSTSFFIQVF